MAEYYGHDPRTGKTDGDVYREANREWTERANAEHKKRQEMLAKKYAKLRCDRCGCDGTLRPRVYESDPEKMTYFRCRCGNETTKDRARDAFARSPAEELVLAHRGVRWNQDNTSRNPHYHRAVEQSRCRLSIAVTRVVEILDRKAE